MIRKLKFQLRQVMKMLLQNCILPLIYRFWCLVYGGREKDLIILADSHHEALPSSMEVLRERLIDRGLAVTEDYFDLAKMSAAKGALRSMAFMKLYARARFVFICDNFLPVVSCKKSEKTTVVQLWHSCGLLKKFGYHTTEDIPADYRGSVYRNYDLVTVSAPCCVEPLTGAMRQKPGVVQPLGVSRTDRYFDEEWIRGCREDFYRLYPEAAGKKIVLWAPTFRGNAIDAYQVGLEEIRRLEQQLGEGYFLIRKVHPHVDVREHLSNCDIITERLLPVADLLISDYSSVINEYMIFAKPFVLFAPDLGEFRQKRGFYIDYESLSPYMVTDGAKLADTVLAALNDAYPAFFQACREYHLAACDGHATERILNYIGL